VEPSSAGSIGWATPAAFGIALADPSGHAVLITGEGSHQLTACVPTLGELDDAMKAARLSKSGAYIKIIGGKVKWTCRRSLSST
jgi:hypothetical protein